MSKLNIKCPYITKQTYESFPSHPTYKGFGVTDSEDQPQKLHITDWGSTGTSRLEHTTCIEEDCAAWQDGKCVRKS